MLDRLRRMEPFGSAVWADFRHSRRTLPSDFTPASRNRDDGGKQVEIYRLGHVVVGPELRTLWLATWLLPKAFAPAIWPVAATTRGCHISPTHCFGGLAHGRIHQSSCRVF